MKIPEPYFADIPEIGNLVMDYIILDYDYPLLFVCREETGRKLYLCVCCDTYKEQRWLITPTSEQILQEMLENRRTIREAFEEAKGLCCVAIWSQEAPKEQYKMLSAKEFEQGDLPEKGEFLDAEGEEYCGLRDYISTKRINYYAYAVRYNTILHFETFNTCVANTRMTARLLAYYKYLTQPEINVEKKVDYTESEPSNDEKIYDGKHSGIFNVYLWKTIAA